MTDTYKYDVFISYARKDGLQHAERLEAQLQSAGYTTWRDKRNLDRNQDFSAEIEIISKNQPCLLYSGINQ